MREQANIKVLIVDQHTIVRNGLRFSLSTADDIVVVGETDKGDEVLPLCQGLEPQVVIIDIALPGIDGITVTSALRDAHPNVQVLIITACDDCAIIQAALQAGAVGILFKDASPFEVIAAVRATSLGLSTLAKRAFVTILDGNFAHKASHVANPDADNMDYTANGSSPLPDNAAQPIRENVFSSDTRLRPDEARNDGNNPFFILTLREHEILKFVLLGYTSAEIGYRLFISHRTVEKHRSNIMRKLNVLNQAELIALAYRLGFMPSDEAIAESRRPEREPNLNLFSFRVSERKSNYSADSNPHRSITVSK